ncbi:MAG: glycosyltransferase [Nanoarchaeota archaeon]|nr:glycosyltransferase [Nanoarchaeota archaeon]
MSGVKVSVVGLSYNSKELFGPFIDSIYKSSLKKDEIEVIIVDNASSDRTVEFLRKNYPQVRIIARNVNIGSGAHNDALAIAKGEYLLYTDSDMKLDKYCLERLYNTGKKLGKKALLTPILYDYDTGKQKLSSYSKISKSFYSVFVEPEHVEKKLREVAMAGFIFMHRDVSKELKYVFDTDFFLYAEDFDLSLRIRLQGFKLYSCPDAIMLNKPPSETTRKYLSQIKLMHLTERNLLLTFFKICSIRSIILYSPYVVGMRLFALARDLLRRNPRMFMGRLKAYLWILQHFSFVMGKRKKTQKRRKVNDKVIFSIAGEGYFLKSVLGFFRKK